MLQIDPMRTVLRTDDNIPVGVPNKAITDMIVSNESRITKFNAISDFKAGSPAPFVLVYLHLHKLPSACQQPQILALLFDLPQRLVVR